MLEGQTPFALPEYRVSAYQAQVKAYQARIRDYTEWIYSDIKLEKAFKKWIETKKRKLYESEHLPQEPDDSRLDPV